LLARCERLTVIELDRDLARRLRGMGGIEVIESGCAASRFRRTAQRARSGCACRQPAVQHLLADPVPSCSGYVEHVIDQHFMLQKKSSSAWPLARAARITGA
jgi:16S rRNA (adenine1518-N6/adenine1519-N6)-dimethyltransferase